jgi:hypothetical protein
VPHTLPAMMSCVPAMPAGSAVGIDLKNAYGGGERLALAHHVGGKRGRSNLPVSRPASARFVRCAKFALRGAGYSALLLFFTASAST